MKIGGVSRTAVLAGILTGPLVGAAVAQEDKDRDTVFVLGRIENGISNSDGQAISASSVSADDMRKFDRATVDQALDLIPGANASNTGGSRNERLIFVRGFDRFQTTLSIDGVRVFLPADNRIDFGRFLTADLAEVQVSKGYVSVLNGPGGLGGAINLVTRKPSKESEAELIAGFTSDGEFELNSHSVSALLGTRQGNFYAQVSGAETERNSWTLSGDFHPVAPALEDGGKRGNSASDDWRLNFKFGWTPNDTDEYAISYTKMSGDKNAPYHVSDTASTRFWSWPYWDIDSTYLLTRTQLAPNLTLRSRVYYNTFKNLLSSFDSAAQNSQTLPRAFKSYYDDTAYGANVSLEAGLWDGNKLTGSFQYRDDEHNERQYGFTRTPATGSPSINAPYIEPWQKTEEETFSTAIEDVQTLGGGFELVGGISYDWTNLRKATDANVQVTGTTIANSVISFLPVNYPLKDMSAFNAQAALVWNATNEVKLHASVSDRTRFPTLFERFSSRFGTAIPNPDVKPERAINYEIGGTWNFLPKAKLEGAVFYTDLSDALVQVPVVLAAPFGTVNQTRNAGSANYAGAEVSLEASVADFLDLGGNLTWIDREFDQVAPTSFVTGSTPPISGADPTNPAFEPQGVPNFKGFFYANFYPTSWLTVTPSLDVASDRWTVTSSSAIVPPQFYKTGGYALVNLSVNWDLSPNASLLLAGKNLMDENYVLVDGFPEEGRNFSISLRLRN